MLALVSASLALVLPVPVTPPAIVQAKPNAAIAPSFLVSDADLLFPTSSALSAS